MDEKRPLLDNLNAYESNFFLGGQKGIFPDILTFSFGLRSFKCSFDNENRVFQLVSIKYNLWSDVIPFREKKVCSAISNG